MSREISRAMKPKTKKVKAWIVMNGDKPSNTGGYLYLYGEKSHAINCLNDGEIVKPCTILIHLCLLLFLGLGMVEFGYAWTTLDIATYSVTLPLHYCYGHREAAIQIIKKRWFRKGYKVIWVCPVDGQVVKP